MALINCPECTKEISDKAKSCPHCGYELPKQEPMFQGVYCPKCLRSGVKTSIDTCPYCHGQYKNSIYGTVMEVDNFGKNHPELKQSPEYSEAAYQKRINYVPYQYDNINITKCPYCNSANLSKITTTKKAVKVGLFGIFGAIDNAGKNWKCNNCGSKF